MGTTKEQMDAAMKAIEGKLGRSPSPEALMLCEIAKILMTINLELALIRIKLK